MTAKEKAEQLVKKFIDLETELSGTGDYVFIGHQTTDSAKKCALICVNESLNITKHFADKQYDFYQEVKQEMEKL